MTSAETGFTPSTVLPKLVGYEWDAISPGCSTPPLTDLFHLSGTPNYDSSRYTASFRRVYSAPAHCGSAGASTTAPGTGVRRSDDSCATPSTTSTRPAPPSAVVVTRSRNVIRIAVDSPVDPRPRQLLVYAHAGA